MPEKHDPSKAAAVISSGEVVVVYTTFPSFETARAAARRIVEQRLAACVNIVPGMVAVYAWEGALHEDQEVVAVFKTRRSLWAAVVHAVCEGHPYENPAALVLEVSGGSPGYIDWLLSSTEET